MDSYAQSETYPAVDPDDDTLVFDPHAKSSLILNPHTNSSLILDPQAKSPKPGRPRPTLCLLVIMGFASLSVVLVLAINNSALNLTQSIGMKFVNQSYIDHYGCCLSQYQLGLLWGSMVAAPLFSGLGMIPFTRFLADRFGRRRCVFTVLPCISLPVCFATTASVWLNSFELFLTARIAMGIHGGLAMGFLTLYVSECTPPLFSGLTGAFTSMSGTGIVAVTLAITLPQALGTESLWHITFLLPAAMNLATLVVGCFVPESPKYSYMHLQDEGATVFAIKKFYGANADISKVIRGYRAEMNQANVKHNISIGQILRNRHLRKGLLIGSTAAYGRGICGANLYIAYSTNLLIQEVGVDPLTAKYITLGLVLPNFFEGAFTAAVIDRVGHRTMYLSSYIAMTVFNSVFVLLTALNQHYPLKELVYASVGFVLLANWCVPLGLSPVGFFLASQITPHAIRSKCAMIANACLMSALLVQTLLFPTLRDRTGPYAIVILAIGPSIPAIVYLYRNMPDTRNKSSDEIVQGWMKVAAVNGDLGSPVLDLVLEDDDDSIYHSAISLQALT